MCGFLPLGKASSYSTWIPNPCKLYGQVIYILRETEVRQHSYLLKLLFQILVYISTVLCCHSEG